MALTIPIFRALIANDPDRRYFRHFGSLGYALKDQQNPDYQEAIANLSIAIEVRGPLQSNGWPFYEWNRAVCRIRLDEAFANGQPTSMPTKGEIIDDLTAASGWLSPEALSPESGDQDSALVGRWLHLNKAKLH